jgi:glycogen operon protein
VIYELHVRGFSQNPNSGVSSGTRGTFAGVTEKIPYFQDLGVTAVELMPVFQNNPEGGDYWGYMPFGFFAPNQRYAGNPNPVDCRSTFSSMVDSLHAAGITNLVGVDRQNHRPRPIGCPPDQGLTPRLSCGPGDGNDG